MDLILYIHIHIPKGNMNCCAKGMLLIYYELRFIVKNEVHNETLRRTVSADA